MSLRYIALRTRPSSLAFLAITATTLYAQTTKVIDVNEPRPLSRALDLLEIVVGNTINYEDPPYENMADLQDVSTSQQRAANPGYVLLVPRDGHVTAEVQVPLTGAATSNEVTFSVNLLLASYRQNQLPGDFQITQANGMLYVTPTKVLGANGVTLAVTSPMAASVTVPYAQRSVADTAAAIFDEVYKVTGLRIVIGSFPFSPTDMVSFAASGNCSVAGATVHLTGAGSCTITASQSGDTNYNPAADVPQSFAIAKGSQTITFGALPAKTFGDVDFAVSATASSSLAVTFSAIGNCTVAGSTVHVSSAGSCTITASQAGDSNYNPALDVPQTLTINKALPVVTLSCPGVNFDLNAHGCTASVTGIGNVTVSGTTTLSYNSNPAPPANAGTYSVSASFTSGDGNYADAAGSGSLAIAKARPTVSVACPSSVVYDGSTHACTAAATGVSNAVVSGALGLTYNGGTAPSSGGTYAVSASFTSGDPNYSDGAGAGSITIAQAGQTITFAALATKTFGDPDFTVSATASSSLAVSFSASGNCSLTGGTVHLTGAGSCTVTASQAGNANYNPAASVPRSFTINSGGDFTIAPTLPAVSVTAVQSVIEHITLTPNPTTLAALNFTCSGLPAKSSCRFAPNPVPAGSAPTDVVMTITTTATQKAAMLGPRVFYAEWLGFSGMGLIGVVVVRGRRKSRRKAGILATFALIVLLMTVMMTVSCGGGGTIGSGTVSGTPPGTSTVTVSGTNANFTHSTTLRLTVN